MVGHIPRLDRRAVVNELLRLFAELLARQIEDHVPDAVVAVDAAVVRRQGEDLTAEDILRKERRYRALTEGRVVFIPAAPQSRRAGFGAPQPVKSFVEIGGGYRYPRISDLRRERFRRPTLRKNRISYISPVSCCRNRGASSSPCGRDRQRWRARRRYRRASAFFRGRGSSASSS